MKNLIYLTILLLFFNACNTGNCDGFKTKFTPMWHEAHFELLKPDGTSYENQEVKISSPRKFENGQLVPAHPSQDEWHELYEVNYHDSIPDIKIFGKGCEGCEFTVGVTYGGGPGECGYGYFENWNKELIYLIEFPDQQLDTLLINDILEPGGKRSFKYYINSVEVEMNYFMYYQYLQIIH